MRFVLTGLTVAILSACAAPASHDTQPTAAQHQSASQQATEFTSVAESAWQYQREQRHPADGLLDI